MNMRKILLSLTALAAAFMLAAVPVLANCGKCEGKSSGKMCALKNGAEKSKCAMSSGKCAMKSGGMEKSKCPITAKSMWMAHELLKHRESLGLTDEEVAKIKGLKLEMAKGSIRQEAEMQVFMLEMSSRLHKSEIDVEEFESFIDSSMAAMATSAKTAIKNYAELRAIVTPERIAKIKNQRQSAKMASPEHAH